MKKKESENKKQNYLMIVEYYQIKWILIKYKKKTI